ncbi:MAG: ATP-binding cassette domain-containing protein [Clostridia bacterium]|nr:ATP-binding cassette domain-containing protein [Clostridia bacterium]MBR5043979.1 ATP-binding cassette domain-containing protein [Clostridia bacterium]
MAYLTVSDLSFTYHGAKTPALTDCSLSVEEGDFLLIVGRSGCGKTTLLRSLKPALVPYGETTGSVTLGGIKTADLSPRDAPPLIGFVGQDPERQTVCDTVFAEIAFGLENVGEDGALIPGRVAEAADFLGIASLASRKISELSGGEKQLVNLAAALAFRPRLLLLDEPVTRLDPPAKLRFLSAVRRINEEAGVTVILAGHDTEELFSAVDRVALMDGGRIVSVLSPRAFVCEPAARPFLPTVPRIWLDSDGTGDPPISVREGRAWLRATVGAPAGEIGAVPGKETDVAPQILVAKDVWFRYGRNQPDVVKNLSCSLAPGEILSILGPNGAGKTTLIKLLAGILRPVAGTVRFDGRKTVAAGRDGIAYLPQNPALLFARDSVREELNEMTEGRPDTESRIAGVAERFALTDLYDAHPYDLSGGEQTRLALAKLLLLSPRVLLLDEPTAGLDPLARRGLRDVLSELAAEGRAILLATHDLTFASEVSDRCAMFFDGKLTFCAETHRFFSENRFYTTQSVRLTHGILPVSVTADEAIAALRNGRRELG